MRLTLALYPLGAGAMAVNIYFLSLILSWIRLPILSPGHSVLAGLVIGLPVAWLFARFFRRMIVRIDGN